MESHGSRYSIHPGVTKMYRDLKRFCWWSYMIKYIMNFLVKFQNCQQVKYEDQRPIVLYQRIQILVWKWERIDNFRVGISNISLKFNAI